MAQRKERIPELDVLRGVSILGMIPIHLLFDLELVTGKVQPLPLWVLLLSRRGHLIFILLSGICVTLGSRSFRRGLQVLGAGLLVSYATLFGELILGLPNIRIWFGILHFLGIAMLLYPAVRPLPVGWLSLLTAAALALGFYLQRQWTSLPWLFPLGLCSREIFPGSDYFPLFPNLGWFLLGAVLGKLLYREPVTRLPEIPWSAPLLHLLSLCGRHSLLIYLLHQPVLMGGLLLLSQ